MDETVTIRVSNSQVIALTAFYIGLVALTIFIVRNPILMIGTVAVTTIFLVSDFKKAMRANYSLTIKKDGAITLSHLSIETCYPGCRMYYNRWCMVMKLKNSRQAETLLLTPDRFEDKSSYARARYHLMRLQESDHAA